MEASTAASRVGPLPVADPGEIELAATLTERLPSAEHVRFTNSGNEAVMMAIKGARAYTGRPKIAKFEGAYHDSYDYAEVSLSSTPESWGRLAAPAAPRTRAHAARGARGHRGAALQPSRARRRAIDRGRAWPPSSSIPCRTASGSCPRAATSSKRCAR